MAAHETKVWFVKQHKPEKAKLLCELAEERFEAGGRVLLFLRDEQQALALDRFLWTWKKGAFLPHAFDNGAVECYDEPIVISCKEDNVNGAKTLIMGNPCPLEFMAQFTLVIDLAELYDDYLLEQSRQRFRLYRENGFHPEMYSS